METLAADVAAVLDACGVERVTVVGHSLGGYVSLAFARMFAERVSRLALVCSRIDADAPEIQARRLALADRIEAAGSIEPVIEAYLPLLIPPETATRRPDLVERLREIMAATKPEGAAAMLRGMAARVASDDIGADLDVPMLVVAGSLDALIPPQQSRYAASAFPRGHLEMIEGSGHMPMLEYPDRITAALGELLALS
jgi:pimeloyl-ACP methyl ester carboxylesterase